MNFPNIIWILPQFCQIIRNIDYRDIVLVDVFLVDQLRLKKFRNIDDGGDDDDGNDVHENPGADGPASQGLSVVERMADSCVPEQTNIPTRSAAKKENCN